MGEEKCEFPDWLCTAMHEGRAEIELSGTGIAVLQGTALREVPGLRFVCPVDLEGRRCVAKFYNASSSRARRHYRREVRGLEALHSIDQPTPAIIYRGADRNDRVLAVVTERLPGARTLLDVWPSSTQDERRQWTQQTLRILFSQYRSGLIQQDVHLENFLISDGRVFAIDGGGIEMRRTVPGKRTIRSNVALFCAQFPEQDAPLVVDALFDTLAEAGHSETIDTSGLLGEIDGKRRWRERKYLQKIYRNCTAFVMPRTPGRLTVIRRQSMTPELENIIRAPDETLSHGEMLKAGNTCTVWATRAGSGELVIKRYNIKNPGHRFGRMFRETRAARTWRNSHRLLFHGVNCPRPVALVEERPWGLRGRAWAISERVSGVDIGQYLDQAGQVERDAVFNDVAALLKRLAALRVSHGDMKATNLIWDEHGRLCILDLDSMCWHRRCASFQRRQRKDIARLLKNWPRDSAICVGMMQALRAANLPVDEIAR